MFVVVLCEVAVLELFVALLVVLLSVLLFDDELSLIAIFTSSSLLSSSIIFSILSSVFSISSASSSVSLFSISSISFFISSALSSLGLLNKKLAPIEVTITPQAVAANILFFYLSYYTFLYSNYNFNGTNTVSSSISLMKPPIL